MDIDDVLVSVGMGRYQMTSVFLFGLMIMYSGMSAVTYIFTAGDLKYRCEIPGCDNPNPANQIYSPEWLRFTTPHRQETGQPLKCKRYTRKLSLGNGSSQCASGEFDQDVEEWCDGNWVFEDRENTVGTEFGLMCEENQWKLALAGSLNNLGQFMGIPLKGILADKFGRKFSMIFGAVTSAVLSLIQSFSINYPMFLTLELLSAMLSSGIYTATFVLAMELVLPKHRVICYAFLECFFPIGAMLVGLIASQAKDWKLLLQIYNIPALLFLSYIWLTAESMRWLEMRGKRKKVIDTLNKIAKTNKKPLPDLHQYTQTEGSNSVVEDAVEHSIFKEIVRSPMIMWRTIRCSLVWIAAALVYYGLSINATNIAGNKYLNFTLVTAVEIPACLLYVFIMKNMSRKTSLSSMFVLNAVTCALYNFTPEKYFLVKLSFFLIGKLAISIAFSIIYMLTVEIFPTTARTSLLCACSMLARIGSMLAPQTTLLTVYFGEYVTMLVFGAAALSAAAITMTLPESKDIKLPNTIDQAEKIGNADQIKTVDESSL